MEVRANLKDYLKLIKIETSVEIQVTQDVNVEIPIIMFKDKKGELKEFIRGFEKIKNFLKYGYNRIIKNCPLKDGKCIGEKCAWYFIDNLTGDCAMIWQMFRRDL